MLKVFYILFFLNNDNEYYILQLVVLNILISWKALSE
jgi:hypothetical protein